MTLRMFIFTCIALLFTGCGKRSQNATQEKAPLSSIRGQIRETDSIRIYYNYGEADPDIEKQWILHNDGSVIEQMFYKKNNYDLSKTISIQGEKRQTIQFLTRKLFTDCTYKDILKKKNSIYAFDCGAFCVDVYCPGKTITYKYDFGYQVKYSKELEKLMKLTNPDE